MKRRTSVGTAALLLAAVWGAPLALPVAAQDPAPPSPATKAGARSATEKPPSPDQVLERFVRALGGEKALRKVTSRVMKGKFEATRGDPPQTITGEAEVVAVAPDRFYSRVNLGEQGEFVSAFDGQVGWSSNSDGVRVMQGKELEEMRRSSQFQHEMRFRELFPQQRVLEKSEEEGRPVWVVEATPPGGTPEKFYFDAESGLLLRHDSVQVTPDNEVPIEHRYSDYAPVDGVLVPHLLRHKDPNVEWQVTFTEIRQNVAVDAALFSMPAGH